MPKAYIRATTFQIRYQGALLTASQWEAEIRRALRCANEIFRRHDLDFVLSK